LTQYLHIAGVRQQMNKVTSYIDASAIYGSTSEEEEYLRRKKKGQFQLPSVIFNTLIKEL